MPHNPIVRPQVKLLLDAHLTKDCLTGPFCSTQFLTTCYIVKKKCSACTQLLERSGRILLQFFGGIMHFVELQPNNEDLDLRSEKIIRAAGSTAGRRCSFVDVFR